MTKTPRPLWLFPGHANGDRPVVCDLLIALLLIAIVLMVKLAFEQTSFGERLSLKSHDLLHRPLLHSDMPVSIVDMS